MDQKKIDRINELARKAKVQELTPEEAEERAQLRAEYIASYKRNLVASLESIRVVDDKGNKTPLKKKNIPESLNLVSLRGVFDEIGDEEDHCPLVDLPQLPGQVDAVAGLSLKVHIQQGDIAFIQAVRRNCIAGIVQIKYTLYIQL